MTLSKLVLISASTVSVWAQGNALSVTAPAWNGVRIEFLTKLEPPGSELHGGVATGSDRAHRFILDPANKRYFGYDVLLESGGDPQALQLKLAPLSLSPQQAEESGIGFGWKLLSPPRYPVLPSVRVGETIAFDLLVNPSSGQKVVDYLTLRQSGFQASLAKGVPHDFTLADIELSLRSLRISVDGRLVQESLQSGGGIAGTAVWFYLAGQGRFVISLFPGPGSKLQKAGVVAADTLTFQNGSTEYRLQCGAPIAPSPGLYNIYVFHDDAWRPKGEDAGASFLLGAANNAELLIRKK